MNREPINPDDPDLTAYALGEMSLSERREFETKLDASPNAQEELESMDEIMSLLSRGLKNEWSVEMKEPSLEVLPALAEESDSKIIPFQFGRAKKAIGAVAGVAAAVALIAGSMVSFQNVPSSMVADGDNEVDRTLLVASLGNASGVHVPKLVIDQETEVIGNMALSEAIENLENLAVPVDASYLDAQGMVPASQEIPGSHSSGIIPASFSGSTADRVDSYLPPVIGEEGPKTGLIERRVKSKEGAMRIPVGNSSNVVVRGFVSLDDVARSLRSQTGQVLRGFQPVSMSGNPVRSSEDDLRLMAELQTIQQEILSVVEQLPDASPQRAELIQLLDRNRSVISGLKSQFSR